MSDPDHVVAELAYITPKEQKILLKCEFTIVISGEIKKNTQKITNESKRELIKLMTKFNLTETVKIVHSLTGISKKEIYQIAIQLKND